MSRIIVKGPVLKQGGVQQFQTIGAGGAPTALGLFNTIRGKGPTLGEKAAAGLGLAGKGLAAAATVNQTAHQMQQGNLAAPLSAGYTYQGLDPSQMAQGTQQAYAQDMKNWNNTQARNNYQPSPAPPINVAPPVPQAPPPVQTPQPQTNPFSTLGVGAHNPVQSDNKSNLTGTQVPQNRNQAQPPAGPNTGTGTVINPTAPKPQAMAGPVAGAVGSTQTTLPFPTAPTANNALVAPEIMGGKLLPHRKPVQAGTTPSAYGTPVQPGTGEWGRQSSLFEPAHSSLPRQPLAQHTQTQRLHHNEEGLTDEELMPTSQQGWDVNWGRPTLEQTYPGLSAAKELLTTEGAKAAQYEQQVHDTFNPLNQLPSQGVWPVGHEVTENPFIDKMEIETFVDNMYDVFGSYLHKASPQTAGALALRLFFGME